MTIHAPIRIIRSLTRTAFVGPLIIACPVRAQTALETVAYIVFSAEKVSKKDGYIVAQQSEKNLELVSNGPANSLFKYKYTITQQSDCIFNVKGAKSNLTDRYDFTLDFGNLRVGSVSVKSMGAFNIHVMEIDGVEYCTAEKSSNLSYNGSPSGPCSSPLKIEVHTNNEVERKNAALKYLVSKYCKVSAF